MPKKASTMRTISRITMAIFAITMLVQVSSVSAQGSAKKQMTQKQGSAKKQMQTDASAKTETMVKAPVSRAFTNGYNVPSSGVAIDGYCPVCYLSANKAAKGTAEFAHDYKGVTYWFVHEGAPQAFIKNPEKFLPAYGGWCAVGVATGQRFPVDPTNFKIVDGRILLFLKNAKVDAATIWDKDSANMLNAADKNWKKLGS